MTCKKASKKSIPVHLVLKKCQNEFDILPQISFTYIMATQLLFTLKFPENLNRNSQPLQVSFICKLQQVAKFE